MEPMHRSGNELQRLVSGLRSPHQLLGQVRRGSQIARAMQNEKRRGDVVHLLGDRVCGRDDAPSRLRPQPAPIMQRVEAPVFVQAPSRLLSIVQGGQILASKEREVFQQRHLRHPMQELLHNGMWSHMVCHTDHGCNQHQTVELLWPAQCQTERHGAAHGRAECEQRQPSWRRGARITSPGGEQALGGANRVAPVPERLQMLRPILHEAVQPV
mmetsp:Transcript_114533/g.329079  ORF Transcript_114533/g.329079 Transcript_114533/m.329079 type:complete len:213 (+) Transcript_114533:169-807(+)